MVPFPLTDEITNANFYFENDYFIKLFKMLLVNWSYGLCNYYLLGMSH